MNRSVLVL